MPARSFASLSDSFGGENGTAAARFMPFYRANCRRFPATVGAKALVCLQVRTAFPILLGFAVTHVGLCKSRTTFKRASPQQAKLSRMVHTRMQTLCCSRAIHPLTGVALPELAVKGSKAKAAPKTTLPSQSALSATRQASPL